MSIFLSLENTSQCLVISLIFVLSVLLENVEFEGTAFYTPLESSIFSLSNESDVTFG